VVEHGPSPFAAGLLGAACSAGHAPAPPAGHASEALVYDCNDCGDGWYCDTEGNVVYSESDGQGNCIAGDVITCTLGCQNNGCFADDTCL
jgi:hypothetical protein